MTLFLVAFPDDLQLQQDPPPGDLPPGTGSSCSRILRLDPEQLPGETAWKWTGMDRNGLQRLRRGAGKIFAGGGGTQARKEALQSSSVIRCLDPDALPEMYL